MQDEPTQDDTSERAEAVIEKCAAAIQAAEDAIYAAMPWYKRLLVRFGSRIRDVFRAAIGEPTTNAECWRSCAVIATRVAISNGLAHDEVVELAEKIAETNSAYLEALNLVGVTKHPGAMKVINEVAVRVLGVEPGESVGEFEKRVTAKYKKAEEHGWN